MNVQSPVSSTKNTPYLRAALWVFLLFSVAYISATRGHFIGTDEIALYQTTRSLWEKGDLSTGYGLNNTFPGSDGQYYAQYSAGQSIAAVPLYGLGKGLEHVLRMIDKDKWIAIFAGPSIGQEPSRWGGDIEIFFVNLFNCFITALLCAVFFVFSLRLGASPRWALVSSALLGTTSFIAPFSAGFLQHSSEALFLLWAFYFLFLNAREPGWRSCLWAGIMAALIILFRFPSVIALPWLGLYLIWVVCRRKRPGATVGPSPREAFSQLLAFAFPMMIGLLLHFTTAYVKFGTIWGKYNNEGFHTPLLKGLYAFLFSPGDSILLFSPLLLTIPWIYCQFRKQRGTETLLIFSLTVTYLVFYGTYSAWHGLWSSMGPRYLVPIVPILLLPLGRWMQCAGKKAWIVLAPLSLVGFWIQLVHFAVNFAFVYHYEKYPEYSPPYGFLFIPDVSPIVAHTTALLAGDYRVDMWLVNVYRNFDAGYLIILTIPLLVMLAWCLRGLSRSLDAAEVYYEKTR